MRLGAGRAAFDGAAARVASEWLLALDALRFNCRAATTRGRILGPAQMGRRPPWGRRWLLLGLALACALPAVFGDDADDATIEPSCEPAQASQPGAKLHGSWAPSGFFLSLPPPGRFARTWQ